MNISKVLKKFEQFNKIVQQSYSKMYAINTIGQKILSNLVR